MTDYIKVSCDDDGEVRVEDNDGGIKTFSYYGSYEKGCAKKAAEKLAAKIAKKRGCDWGYNY